MLNYSSALILTEDSHARRVKITSNCSLVDCTRGVLGNSKGLREERVQTNILEKVDKRSKLGKLEKLGKLGDFGELGGLGDTFIRIPLSWIKT